MKTVMERKIKKRKRRKSEGVRRRLSRLRQQPKGLSGEAVRSEANSRKGKAALLDGLVCSGDYDVGCHLVLLIG
jgi:hypothetical protein